VRAKFGLQILAALVVGIILQYTPGFDSKLNVPFFKNITPDLAGIRGAGRSLSSSAPPMP